MAKSNTHKKFHLSFPYTPHQEYRERMKFKGIFSACLMLVTWSSQKRRERKMLEKTFLKSKEFSFLLAVFYFLGTLQQWQNRKIVLWEIELLSLRQPSKFLLCSLCNDFYCYEIKWIKRKAIMRLQQALFLVVCRCFVLLFYYTISQLL